MADEKNPVVVHGRVYLDGVEISKDDPRIPQLVRNLGIQGNVVVEKDIHLYSRTATTGLKNSVVGDNITFKGKVTF